MSENLRQITLQEAATGLNSIDGAFLKGVVCNKDGNKSAHGKLLMLLGVLDKDMVDMKQDVADDIIGTRVIGISDIQIALLHFVNDETSRKCPSLTGRLTDVLSRPERFLGSKSGHILTLDRLLHSYTEEQLSSIPQLEWDSWEIIAAQSVAIHCATIISHLEAGDCHSAYTDLYTNSARDFNARSAAVLDAWDVSDVRVEKFGHRRVHTKYDSWWIGRQVARGSTRSFNSNVQRIYMNAINEIQGYGMYETLKPDKDHPNRPEHRPLFIGMLPDLTGNPLTMKILDQYSQKHKV